MAYAIEYRAKWTDINGTEHKIELLKDGYSGSINTIKHSKAIPVELKRRATKTDGDVIIAGTELKYNFNIDASDLSTYDAIFESAYKDYRVDFYVGSQLEFRGWLLPDNFTREFVDNGASYNISLAAHDGLATLKDYLYNNASTPYEDRVSLFEHIVRCLGQIGGAAEDFDLDFRIQLNTYESNEMLSTYCVLDRVTADSRRFNKSEDGKSTNDNCEKVVSELLKPFNAMIMQSKGKYYIVNYLENSGKTYQIAWTTGNPTFVSPVTDDLNIDVSSYKFVGRGSTEKIRPLKEVQVRFEDINIGGNLVTDGDFSSGGTGWTKSSALNNFSVISGRGLLNSTSVGSDQWVKCQNFSASSLTAGALFEISFKYQLKTVSPSSSGYAPKVKIALYYDDGTETLVWQRTNSTNIGMGEVTMESVTTAATVESSNYYIKVFIESGSSGYTSAEVYIDDVTVRLIQEDGENVTYDRQYDIANASTSAIESEERVHKFGDSLVSTDLGAFKVGSILTTEWNRYGKTENLALVQTYAQSILENNQSFKNYNRVKILDEDDNISSHNSLTIDSKEYQIIGYTVSYKAGSYKVISAELRELIFTAISITTTPYSLNTIDGQGGADIVATPSGDQTTIDDNSSNRVSVLSSAEVDERIDTDITAAQRWFDKGSDIYRNTLLQSISLV
jgi:hypothetical protein